MKTEKIKNVVNNFKFFPVVFSFSFLLFIFLGFQNALAASLTMVSDVVGSSALSTSTTHTIEFTLTNAIPASGRIVITPHAGAFTIPSGFDYQDADVAVSSGGPFSERSLAATASATEDGVSVVTGTSGSVTITLSSGSGIAAGEQVRILLGTNASYGATGNTSLLNPSSIGSYRMSFETRDASSVKIDDAGTRIAIVEQIVAGGQISPTPPVRSNGLPSGEIAHGNSVIEISLNTNKPSTCRFATTTAVAYGSMLGTFSYTGGTLHTQTISGHQNATAYSYYVRCIDEESNVNTDDYAISFNLKEVPTTLVSTGTVGSEGGGTASGSGVGGSGGVGDYYGGSPNLYLANVIFSGFTSPLGTVHFLKDGVEVGTTQALSDGSFKGTVTNLERGTYSLSVYAQDSKNRKTALVASTLTVGQGTTNTISGITLPPTVELSSSTIDPGDSVDVFGEGKPGSTVEVLVKFQGRGSLGSSRAHNASVSDGTDGATTGIWEVTIPTTGFERGTYEVKARVQGVGAEVHQYSSTLLLGVGEAPTLDTASRSDINGDGKVNLTDFSIMLSFWGLPREDADINLDGTVGLADFSILLFNWTG